MNSATFDITPEDNGLWYDKDQSGTGFQLSVREDGGVFATMYCGKVPRFFEHASVWFSVQGNINDGPLPLLVTFGAVLGEKKPLALRQVGTVSLGKVSEDTIDAFITINGDGSPPFSPPPLPVVDTWHMKKLI